MTKELSLLFHAVLFVVALDDLQKYEKCTNPYGLNGTCVPLHECPELYNLSTSKNGIDLLFVTKSYCGLDDEVLVCCEYPGHVQLTNVDVNSLLGNKECGIAKEKPRIGGESVEIGEFPWTVALIYETDSKQILEWIPCAGSLINNEYVLTTASCIDYPHHLNLIFVKLGEWNNSTDPDCVDLVANKFCADPVKIVGIKETIVHPLFGIHDYYHDVGLIRLEEKVIFTDFLAPICLPHSKYVIQFPEALGQLTLAGWKHTREPSSHFLTKLTLHVLSDYECQKRRLNDSVGTDRHSFCTEVDIFKLGECEHYNGGPFMKSYNESNGAVWYIHGIESFGIICYLKYKPVIAVSHYVGWIVETVIKYSKIGL